MNFMASTGFVGYNFGCMIVRTSEKVQLRRIGSRTRALQQAMDEVRTLPLSLPEGGSKSELYLFLNETNFN